MEGGGVGDENSWGEMSRIVWQYLRELMDLIK